MRGYWICNLRNDAAHLELSAFCLLARTNQTLPLKPFLPLVRTTRQSNPPQKRLTLRGSHQSPLFVGSPIVNCSSCCTLLRYGVRMKKSSIIDAEGYARPAAA